MLRISRSQLLTQPGRRPTPSQRRWHASVLAVVTIFVAVLKLRLGQSRN
jgi:hypothetical protein